jgi:hypothetical protein
MRIRYFEPLSRSIARMKKDLFKPFNLQKWFVIGFTAFLAGFSEIRSSGFPNSAFRKNANFSIEGLFDFPRRAWEWLSRHPQWTIVICIGIFVLFVIGILMTWLSSRGKFMLLDNVVHGRACVKAPWHEYRREGNSYFVWSFGLGILMLAIVLTYISYCFLSLQAIFEKTGSAQALLIPAILAGLGLFVISIIGNFFSVLLRDFIVPIMYRDRITTLEAILKFSGIFSSDFISFIGYGLFLLGLWAVVMMGIGIIGCGTCCIGFLILMIPYINAVILLPITYAIRSFSLEFLEQFGPDFAIFPKQEAGIPGAESSTT